MVAASTHGQAQATRYFEEAFEKLSSVTDRMFVLLLGAEWVGLVITACVISPRVWSGAESSIHPHVLAALLSGPAFIVPAMLFAVLYPANRWTRHTIAVAQMLVSTVLIDVSGGRIETHFHIFGSLAFLAIYRDWRVLITASVVTVGDHFVRGIWWPESVYGLLTVSPWRWVEHAWWVVFEVFFLILASRRSIGEMWEVAWSKTQLHEDAYHDFLTGLGNRRLLREEFAAARKRDSSARRGVLYIDLDRFRQASESLGLAAGDRLLRMVAARLVEAAGADDTLARIGGDEFVILTGALEPEGEAEELASRVLAAMSKPFDLDDQQMLLSASIGISYYPKDGDDLSGLKDRASRATYAAKAQGRNQWAVFSPEVARREVIRQDIRRDLQGAVKRNEFLLEYQPVIRNNGQLYGFEALLRWKHPVRGMVEPADFVSLAERSGGIIEIGEWVLAEACRSCRDWQREGGLEPGVAVNVSSVQFEDPDFCERVIRILRNSGLQPGLLTVELTETVLVRDLPRARRILQRLRGEGVQVALDDFGTGYSSLSYLTALPADIVKLDRSFLSRDFLDAAPLIESIILMAHKLGLRVVAEGVESAEQRAGLRSLRCDAMQGFYFSAPLGGEVLSRYLAAAAGGQRVAEDSDMAGAASR